MIELISHIKTLPKQVAPHCYGTGVEMMARLFHYYGSRKNKPMITVNYGAIPSELVKSEFIGHEKGAFIKIFEH